MSYVDARGSTTSPNLPDYRTSGQQRFFSYRTSTDDPASNTFADGERLRLSPQGYYYYGPWGLLAEYVSVSQDVDRAVGATIRDEDLHHDAWQIAGSYVLTGEESTYKGVKPVRPFSIRERTLGRLRNESPLQRAQISTRTASRAAPIHLPIPPRPPNKRRPGPWVQLVSQSERQVVV